MWIMEGIGGAEAYLLTDKGIKKEIWLLLMELNDVYHISLS